MALLNHGLSALMEACKQSENAEAVDESLLEAYSNAVDDDIKACLTDDDNEGDTLDDSVEADMSGEGVGDEDEKMEKLLKHIPPSDEGVEDQIESLSESLIPSDELDCVF